MKSNNGRPLDCVVVGYNELPFEQYEGFLRQYGEESEAYRDLKFSFVDVGGKKLDYMGLLNHVTGLATPAGRLTPGQEFKSGDIPNLAAVYLTNYLRHRGHTADYINLFQHEKEKFIEYLDRNPVCVAITTTFYVVNLPVNDMVEFIRKHNSRVKIVVGGPLIANHHRNSEGDAFKAALDDMGADIYVIEGQGEETLAKIVGCLKDGGDLGAVPNIAYVEGGSLRQTAVKAENSSLDENAINWLSFADERLGPTIQTRTARSCAFKCSFCNYPGRAGALTLLSIEGLEKELDSMLALGDVGNVVFIDDTFNVPFPRFKDICRMMIKRKYPFNWFSYFRCSNSDEEAIELMAESGCKGVFLGIESGSPSILANMNKAATIEKYATGIEWLRQYGILSFGSFITGFPGETDETVRETLDFIGATQPDYFRSQMWYSEPGTPIQLQRDKYGISGEGFVWSHKTMDSMEAMDHIDRMFLTADGPLWLPQWSFDFWSIPYLLGRGLSLDQLRGFMAVAHKLLTLEIASVPPQQKRAMQQDYLGNMVDMAKGWNLSL
ncbi:MAG: PhpK family radical SAM P-methyltransferase [Acidobacteria bacterium]|nr:PhpK family radical SAM P-methyltransferase [Acidobacteriota bacterium]